MYLAKFFKSILTLVICIAMLASCTKEEPVLIDETKNDIETTASSSVVKQLTEMKASESNQSKLCFDFVYPLELVFADKSTQSINSFNELLTSMKEWFEKNRDSEIKEPVFKYPVKAKVSDGEFKVIKNSDELVALVISCKNGVDDDKEYSEKEDCFEINYPVTVIFADRTTQLIENKEAHEILLKDKETDKPTFQFPIEITFKEGKTFEVKSEKDLKELYKKCKKHYEEYEDDKEEWGKNFDLLTGFSDCFEVNYPVTLVLHDGTTRAVNDEEEVIDWIKSDAFQKFTLQFPIEITFKEEDLKTIHSEEELVRIYTYCKEAWDDKVDDDGGDWGDFDWDGAQQFNSLFSNCFEVNYPITLILQDGSTQVVNSQEEVFELMRGNGREAFSFEFPINITIKEEAHEINSLEDLVKLYVEKCVNIWEDDKEAEENDDWNFGNVFDEFNWDKELDFLSLFSDCFQINYPITLVFEDGTNPTINSRDDMAALIRSTNRQAFTFQFPINVSTAEEERKEIATEEALYETLKTCFEQWTKDRDNWIDLDWDEDFEDFDFFEDCFKISYPISVTFEERGELAINNNEEFKRVISTILRDTFGGGNALGNSKINYPIEVSLENGSTQTLNSDEDLWKMMEDCE